MNLSKPYGSNSSMVFEVIPLLLFPILIFTLGLDTPFPIDPFTFVSSPVYQEKERQQASNSLLTVPATTSNGQAPNSIYNPATEAASTSALLVPAKRNLNKAPQLPPKTPFPDAYLPFLIQKITSLATSNLTFIVESVYQDLKDQKVKKNAIEAKVREISEKSQKLWVVKQDVLVSCNSDFQLETTLTRGFFFYVLENGRCVNILVIIHCKPGGQLWISFLIAFLHSFIQSVIIIILIKLRIRVRINTIFPTQNDIDGYIEQTRAN